MLKDIYPLYLANEARQPNADLEVTDKFTGEVVFRVAVADAATIDAAIAACVDPLPRAVQKQPADFLPTHPGQYLHPARAIGLSPRIAPGMP